jgi:F-type H+-transporting ATPase subunit O
MLARRALTGVPTQSRAASSIALKYANAAFGAVKSKPNELNKLSEDLTSINADIKSTPSLSQFISNPTISAKDRAKGLETVYAAAEAQKKTPVSTATKNLFSVLSENGRLAETPGVIEGFNALMSAYRGEATVVVTSAAPLPRDIMTRLESALKGSQTAQKAKSLKITNKVRLYLIVETATHFFFGKITQVNPSVLGGIVVDFGDKTVDLSVASRVNKLNSLLQGLSLFPCLWQVKN